MAFLWIGSYVYTIKLYIQNKYFIDFLHMIIYDSEGAGSYSLGQILNSVARIHSFGTHEDSTMEKRHQRRQPSPAQTSSSLLETVQLPDEKTPDYEQGLIRLLYNGQRLCGQREGVAARLCQEVAQITRGQVQLVLYCRETAGPSPQRVPPIGTISFPVQFGDLNYGTLYVQNDPAHPTQPIIPPATVYLQALVCASILYALENSALLQLQYEHLKSQACEPLTRREREVLPLLCRGYDAKAIAELLHIAPTTVGTYRQRIYEKLHIHDAHDLLLVAFRAGLFFPLEGISGVRSRV